MKAKRVFGYETSSDNYNVLKEFSKNNRRYMTPAEAVLWDILRGKQLDYRFRRQHPVGDYIPDFVCLPKRLVVEVDGIYHSIGNQPVSDAERTRYLNERGFKVIRFTNNEIIGNTNNIIKTIKEAMNSQPTMTTPLNQTTEASTAPASPLNQATEASTAPATTLNQATEASTAPATPLNQATEASTAPATTLNQATEASTAPATPLLRRGRGRLIIFSAPSGSGKSTIINWLMQHEELHMAFSISCTSRPPRGTEQNGVEYFFLTPDEFRQRIERDEFVEYEEVYEGRFYGTLKSQVEHQLEQGQNVVFDVDVNGGMRLKQYYGQRALSIFIQPPSIAELRRRLEGRATDAPEVIDQRIARAEYEMSQAVHFDRIIVNDRLEAAQHDTLQAIADFLAQAG